MRFSAYNFCTDLGGGNALLTNLLTRTVIRASEPQQRLFDSLSGATDLASLDASDQEFLGALVEGLFIVPDDFDELSFIREAHSQARQSNRLKTVVIAPTMRCNMSCHYCFEDKPAGSLSEEDQTRLLARIETQLGGYEGLHIQWFGGEPLLEIGLMRSLSAKLSSIASRLGVSYSAEIITNGVLLDHDLARDLPSLGVREIQVTLEGVQRFHDKVRFTENHANSFDLILRSIKTASDYVDVNVRVHVAPYSIDRVFELLDYLQECGVAPHIHRIYFSPLFNYKTDSKLRQFQPEPNKFLSAEEFAAAQAKLVRRANELGMSTGDPLSASYGLCIAMLDGTEVIGPSGTVSKCYLDTNVKSKAHDTLDGNGAAPEVGRIWNDYDFSADAECAACKFSPVCLGGCPSQEMHQADKSIVCTPLRYNFDERMRMAYGTKRESTSQCECD